MEQALFLVFFLIISILLTSILNIHGFLIVAVILIILVIVITFTWFNVKELLNHKECLIGDNKKINGLLFNGCFDYYHILHVLLFIQIGILYPNNYLLIVIISIIWELYEHFMFKFIIKKSNCNDFICLRIEDIFLNLLGYFIGSNIKK